MPQSNKSYSKDSSLTTTEPIYQGIVEKDISAIRNEAEVSSLKEEMSNLKLELARAQKARFVIEDSEKELKEKLAEEKHKIVTLERMVS